MSKIKNKTQKTTQKAVKKSTLFEAMLKLKTATDCENFFIDLCTPAEIRALLDRWTVVQLLEQDIPYRTIYEQTGVSTATVTRVARCLTYGTGYRLLLGQKSNSKKTKKKSFTKGDL